MSTLRAPDAKWVTREYAVRLAAALVIASIVTGALNGALRVGTAEGLVQVNGAVGRSAITWQAIQSEVVIGLAVAAVPSFFAVVLHGRPRGLSAARRILVGPLLAGILLCAFSALWGGSHLWQSLGMTAIACTMFISFAWAFRVLTAPPKDRGDARA